jgi:hypothetical protein
LRISNVDKPGSSGFAFQQSLISDQIIFAGLQPGLSHENRPFAGSEAKLTAPEFNGWGQALAEAIWLKHIFCLVKKLHT